MQVIAEDINRIVNHLVEEGDFEIKIRKILENEIRRRLAQYEVIDRTFQKKYGMSIEQFEKERIVQKKGYSFEVESDYHDWDAAVDTIETLQEDLGDMCQNI